MTFARLFLAASLACIAAAVTPTPASASFCSQFNSYQNNCEQAVEGGTSGKCMFCNLRSAYNVPELLTCVPYNANGCCASFVGHGNCEVHLDMANKSQPCQWCGTFSQTPCTASNGTCPAPEDCYVAQTPLECQMRTDAHNLTCAWCGNYGCVNFDDCHIDHEWPIRPAYDGEWVVMPCSIGHKEDAVVAVLTNHSSTFVAIWEVLVGLGDLRFVRLSDMLVTMPDPIEIPQDDGTFVYEFHIPATNTLVRSGFTWSKFFTNTSQWQLTLRAFDKKVKTWSNTVEIQVNGTKCNVDTKCTDITDYHMCGDRSDCQWCGQQKCVNSGGCTTISDVDGTALALSSFKAFHLDGETDCAGSSEKSSTGHYAFPIYFDSSETNYLTHLPLWYNVSWLDTMPSNKTLMHFRIWPSNDTTGIGAPKTSAAPLAITSFWIYHPAPGPYFSNIWLYDFQVTFTDTTRLWGEIWWDEACPQVDLLLNTAGSSTAPYMYPSPDDVFSWVWNPLGSFNVPNYYSVGTPCPSGTCDNELFCDNCHYPGFMNLDSGQWYVNSTTSEVSCVFEVINSSMDTNGASLISSPTVPLGDTYTVVSAQAWCQELLRSTADYATWYTLEIDAYGKFARCSIYSTGTDQKLNRGIACSSEWPHCETGIAICSRTVVTGSNDDHELSIHPGYNDGTDSSSEKLVESVQSAPECIAICSNFPGCVAWMWLPDTNICLVSSVREATTSPHVKGPVQFVPNNNKTNIVSGVMDTRGCVPSSKSCYNFDCFARRHWHEYGPDGTSTICACTHSRTDALEQPPLLNVHYNWATNNISFDIILPQTSSDGAVDNPGRSGVKASFGPFTLTTIPMTESNCLLIARNPFGEFNVATLVSNNYCSLDSDSDNYRYRCVVNVAYTDTWEGQSLAVTVPLPFSIVAPLKPNVTIGMHHMGVKTLWAYVSKSKATFDAFGNATFLIEVTTLAPIYSVIEPDSIDFDLLGKVTGVELLNYTDVKHNQQLASWNLSITVGSSVCTLSEDDGVMMNFKLNHSTTGVEPHAIKLTIGSFESLCSVTTGVEDNFQNFLFFSDFPDLGQNSSASQGAYNGLFFPNNTIYAGVYLALPWAPRVWPNVTIAAAVATGAGISDYAPEVSPGHHQVDLIPYLHPMPCPVPTMTEYNYQKNLVVCFGLEIMKGYYIPDSEIKVDVTLVIINTTMLDPVATAQNRKRMTTEFGVSGTFKLARAPTAEMRKPEIAAPETPKPLAQQQPQVRIVYRTPFAAYATMLVVALASGWCLAALASYLYNRSRSSSAMLL